MAVEHSAGTIVAAVLQNAGFVAVSNMITWLNDFFGSISFFLVLLAGIIGVGTFVLTGQSRLMLYWIVGPVFYYFLVGITVDIQPTLWRLGDSTPTSVADRFVGPMESYKPPDKIEVPWFLALYTRLIDTQMNEVTRIVKGYENDKFLLEIPKRKALELMLSNTTMKPELTGMLSFTLFEKCGPMMQHMIALSAKELTQREQIKLQAQLGRISPIAGRDADSATLAARQAMVNQTLSRNITKRAVLMANLEDLKKEPVRPSEHMADFISRETKLSLTGDGRDYSALGGPAYAGNPQKFVDDRTAYDLVMSCGQAYEVFADAALKDSKWFLDQIYESQVLPSCPTTPGPARDNCLKAAKLNLCNQLAKKLHPGYVEGPTCDLAPTAMLFMMGSIIRDGSLSKIAQRVKNRSNYMSGARETFCLERFATSDSIEDRRAKLDPSGANEYKMMKFDQAGLSREMLAVRETDGNWCVMTEVEGDAALETAFGIQARYHGRMLMHQIYSYALNMPYYQGMIIFYAILAYPFVALLVFIPTRAKLFLQLPLIWLWVKSWDPGFALVGVLDKILWNYVPSTELGYNSFNALKGAQGLPDLLGAALSTDPSYTLHLHYTFISIALFAVPTVTGALILKARQGLAQVVLGGVQQLAHTTGTNAATAFGQSVQSSKIQAVNDRQGAAFIGMTTLGWHSLNTHPGEMAKDWAKLGGAVAGGAQFMNYMSKQPLSKAFSGSSLGPGGITALMEVAKKSGGARKIFFTALTAEAKRFKTFDPIFGVDSVLARKQIGAIAGLDGSPGFDLQMVRGAAGDIWKSRLELFNEQLTYGLDLVGQFGTAATKIGAKKGTAAAKHVGWLPEALVVGGVAAAANAMYSEPFRVGETDLGQDSSHIKEKILYSQAGMPGAVGDKKGKSDAKRTEEFVKEVGQDFVQSSKDMLERMVTGKPLAKDPDPKRRH